MFLYLQCRSYDHRQSFCMLASLWRDRRGCCHYHIHATTNMGINDGMKSCEPCSTMLQSGLDSFEGNGTIGSSEQLPGDRNSRTTLSTCGLKIWLIFGSTTWATILSTPCSSIPDLRGTVWFHPGLSCNKQSDYWILCDEQQWNGSVLTYWSTSCLMLFRSWFLFKWGLHVWLERWFETKLSTLCFRFK